LRQEVARQYERYRQPILVEQFIRGREVTCGMVGNPAPIPQEGLVEAALPDGLTFLPLTEVNFSRYAAEERGIYTNKLKVELGNDYHYLCPAPLDAAQTRAVQWLAGQTFRALGCRDYARVDVRLNADEADRPYVLEINPLPGISPDYSDLCLQARAYGWDFTRLIGEIVAAAQARLPR
jgi:D-alanine-D-alanine ligase